MSYRTTIEDFQIFGNNETYPEWLEFIKSQGITIDEEGNYSGEIHDYKRIDLVVFMQLLPFLVYVRLF